MGEVDEGPRSGAAGGAADLVAAVRDWPPLVRRQWIDQLCVSVFDLGRPIPLGEAVLELLLEDLAAGAWVGRLHAARWLAQVPRPLDRWLAAAGLAPGEDARTRLLERALEVDPDDRRARRLLLAQLRAELEWTGADPERRRRLGAEGLRARARRVASLCDPPGDPELSRWLRLADEVGGAGVGARPPAG